MGNVVIDFLPKSEINGLITDLQDSTVQDSGSVVTINPGQAIGTSSRLFLRTGFAGDVVAFEIDNRSSDTQDSIFVNQSGGAGILGSLIRLRSNAINRFTVTGGGDVTISGSLDVGANVTAIDMIATG